MGVSGKDCTSNAVVNTANECRLAADQLQRTYIREVIMVIYPAGCFEHNFTVYFNTITDPSLTLPIHPFAGICKGIALYLIYHSYIKCLG